MKPLILTVSALRELATGLAIDAVGDSSSLFRYDGIGADVLVSRFDTLDSQRVIVYRTRSGNFGDFIPTPIVGRRREVLSRMASFAERAKARPLALPRGWGQYRLDNLVAFFAVARGDQQATRWVAELGSGTSDDVIFWKYTTSNAKTQLEEFQASPDRARFIDEESWIAAIEASRAHFEQVLAAPADVDMFLPRLAGSGTSDRSFTGWLEAVSPEQRAFIEAPTDRSIRLLGPAGSGKTLAITLKAVREATKGSPGGQPPRVLVVTHSWALATQIADNMDRLGLGRLSNPEVFPLLEIARNLAPQLGASTPAVTLVGEDSLSGKQAQLDQIVEVLTEFTDGDWITYRAGVSDDLQGRLSSSDADVRLGLAWDLLIEFGSVIGAAGIFPGAGALRRYQMLPRAGWMLPLEREKDRDVVFALYARYMSSLEEHSLVTSDQVLADFLGFLASHSWNRARKTLGYDLVFVDEFHLFSPLERRVLHFLSRNVADYPHVFMALDPRQSPSESFIGVVADETRPDPQGAADEELGDVTSFELTSVHRFTPQILDLVKHVHHDFPTLDLGSEWSIDFGKVESAKEGGPIPRVIVSGTATAEDGDIVRAVHDLYPLGRIALAIVDPRQWGRFSGLAAQIGKSPKFNVSAVSGRADIDGVGYRRHGLVVASAEYLAGLQFESVLIAGIPALASGAVATHENTRFLSLLYLALSRAEREVRVFVNNDDGGMPEVLARAVDFGVLDSATGSQV